MRCSACNTVVPHAAKFCPKCGAKADHSKNRPLLAPDAHPSKSPMPWTGKLFIGAGVLAVGLIVAGIALHAMILVYAGLAVAGVLIVVSLLGHHIF